MNTYTQPCEFANCNCMVQGGTEGAAYCSDACEARDTTDESGDELCPCGHPPCDAQ